MEIVVEGKDSVNYIPQSLPGIAIGGTRKKAFFRLRCQKRMGIGWDNGIVWEKSHLQAGHYWAGDEPGEAIIEDRKKSENCLLFLGFPLFNYISVFIKVSSGQWTMFCASRHNYLIQLHPEGNLFFFC